MSRRDRKPVVLPLGREASAWVRAGGPQANSDWLYRAMARWQSMWFERNLALQRQIAPKAPCRPDPVFVLGLWRSGTTHLHNLLAGCPGMISPSTSQCMNPASLWLRAQPGTEKTVKRPMDGMAISSVSPQEDEFALLALGVPSVYRGFLDPRRLPELARWLDPESWSVSQPEGWAARWIEFLTGISDDPNRRLVLKSPGHTFRIDALPGLFPKAAYIWLVRDPAETFLSNRKMWSAMFQRYALWPPDASVLDSFLCQALDYAGKCLQRATSMLPRDRLVVIHYKELTASTLASLEQVNRRLSLGNWEDMRPSIEPAVAAQAGYRADSYDTQSLPGSVVQASERLRSIQNDAVSTHGIQAFVNP
jgi:hypothetical protein